MNIFVTGGSGFVGGYFVNEALSRDHNVICLKRSNSNPKIALKKGVTWRIGQLDKISSDNLKNIDILAHFASAGVSPQSATWEDLYYWNIASLLHLLKVACDAGVKKIIIAGSFIEYGLSAEDYEYIPPSAALRPTTPYASSKAAGFEMAHGFCIENGIPLVYKRIFSAYGIGQYEKNFWPSLRAAALSGNDFPMTEGDQVRDFISVEQVAMNFMESVEGESPSNNCPLVENVCTGKGQSVRAFAEFWWSHWKATGQLMPGVIPSRQNEPKRFVGMIST